MIGADKILTGIPTGLRDPLIAAYTEIVRNFAESRWEPAELNGGKFCECVYSVLLGYVDDAFSAHPSKPADMVSACRGLEKKAPSPSRIGDRAVRILIPRMLPPLYEIRNNRGVGHVGGDVDPNFLDATAAYSMASWILAELVRVFHGTSTAEAQEIVSSLVDRKHPLVWRVEGMKRVLIPEMDKRDQTLLLLHTEPGWINDDELVKWVEYSTAGMFRTRVLRPLHKARLLEYDESKKRSRISPLGIKQVEARIIRPMA